MFFIQYFDYIAFELNGIIARCTRLDRTEGVCVCVAVYLAESSVFRFYYPPRLLVHQNSENPVND